MSVWFEEATVDLESRYEFLEKLGTGSYATVFRARDRELGREVAVKQIHDQYLQEPKQLDRYWQEAQLLASLQHPNIVTIFDIYRDRGWLILELIQGNLAERMEGRQMDLRALRTTLAHCLRALKYLHSRGVVHGDIKLSNLMIDARKRVKIGDFGLARRVSDDEGSLLKGTTKYMAPEVVSDEFGEIGPQSDLYSLGFSAYDLMCGPNFESLFPGLSAFGRNKQVAWMMWHAAADRRLPEIGRVLEGVPDDLKKVIQRLCEKDQARRYKTADDALSDLNIDLKVVQKGGDGGEDAVGDTQTVDKAKRKRLIILSSIMAASLLVSVLALFEPWKSKTPAAAGSKTLAGIVQGVDADGGKLKILGIEDRVPEEFAIAKRPKIYLLNSKKNILPRELQEGDRIEIQRPPEGGPNEVSMMTVSRPVLSQGTVKRVNPQSGQLVVAIEGGDGPEDLPVRVPNGTEILLNDKKMELRDVKDGDSIGVKHFPETSGKGGRVAEIIRIRRLQQTVGFITEIDPEKRRLTIRTGGTVSQPISRPVAQNCEIRLTAPGTAAQKLELADLARDDRVQAQYDTEFRELVITRDAKKLAGTISEVRPQTREVLVTTGAGRTVTFRVDPEVEKRGGVTLEKENVTVADLRKFDSVEVTYDEGREGPASPSTMYAVRPKQTDRWIILIAGQLYDEKFLSPLNSPYDDAGLIQNSMKTRYAVADGRLKFLRDEKRSDLQAGINDILKDARSQTQVVVYVACHAYVGKDGNVYLAGKDFHWDRMDETGLKLDWLVEKLEECPSQDKILLLDCSHKGTGGKDLEQQPSTAEMVQKPKTPLKSTSIIASCSPGERGLAVQGQPRSLFATCVAEGFAGRADANLDLRVTAPELFAYLTTCMPKTPAEEGGHQTPMLFAPKQ